MKKLLSQQYFVFLFLLVLASVPPLFSAVFGVSSHSLGIMFCSLMLVVLVRWVSFPAPGAIIASCVLLSYFAIQHLFVGSWQAKSYYSLPLFAFVVYVSYVCAKRMFRFDGDVLERGFVLIFYFLTIFGFFHVLTGHAIGRMFGYYHGKQMFPFSEPSHFALFYGVFFIFYIARSKSILGLAMVFLLATALALFIPNATLLVFVLVGFLVVFSKSRFGGYFAAIPAAVCFGLFAVMFISSSEYFSSRLSFSSESDNLSVLVYLQGWDDAINSLRSTNGLGLGFQMLGTQEPSIYAGSIARVMGYSTAESNREDGGFLAAKIVSEFGLAGVVLIFLYLILLVKAVVGIRNSAVFSCDYDKGMVVAASVVTAFSVELFARGIGYFSSQMVIFMVSAFYLFMGGFLVRRGDVAQLRLSDAK